MLHDLLSFTEIDAEPTIELQIYKARASNSTFAINHFNGAFMISCLTFLIEACWRWNDLSCFLIHPKVLVPQLMIAENLNIGDSDEFTAALS